MELPAHGFDHLPVAREPVPQAVQALAGHSWRGRLAIRGEWEAPLAPFFRQAAAVLVREFGF